MPQAQLQGCLSSSPSFCKAERLTDLPKIVCLLVQEPRAEPRFDSILLRVDYDKQNFPRNKVFRSLASQGTVTPAATRAAWTPHLARLRPGRCCADAPSPKLKILTQRDHQITSNVKTWTVPDRRPEGLTLDIDTSERTYSN